MTDNDNIRWAPRWMWESQRFQERVQRGELVELGRETIPGRPSPPQYPKNWNKLSPDEQYIYTSVLPHPTVQKAMTTLESLNKSWVGKILPVFDVFAEGIERGLGVVAQYHHAQEMGPEAVSDFYSHLGAAWRAGSFFYNVSNIFLRPGERGQSYWDLPGYTELYNIRKKLIEGQTPMEIEAELMEDLGALQLRSAMQDAVGHLLLDPGNIILPKIMKLPTRLIQRRGQLLYDLGKVSDETIQFALDAEKVAGETYETALRAARAVYDEASGTWKGARVTPELTDTFQKAVMAAETTAEMEGRALNWWQKTVINLTGGMPLSADTAVDWVNKGPKGLQKLLPWNWFKLTPQSRAMETLNLIAVNTQNIIAQETDYVRMADKITDALKGLTSPQLGHVIATPAGRAAMSWLKGAEVGVQDLLGKMAASATERSRITAIADLIKMPLDEVMGHLVSGEADIVFRKLSGALQSPAGEGMEIVHQLLREMIEGGELGLDTLKAYGMLFKDMPYSAETFKLHLLGALWDHSAKVAVTKFGLEAAGWWTKAADALKAVESLAFLRLNPNYAVINFLNNEITMMARGSWNLMRPDDIIQLWERVGVVHPRLAQGIGMGGLGVRETGEQAFNSLMKAYKSAAGEISGAAQMSEGWVGKLSQKVKNIKLPLDASNWAQAAERSASMRAMTGGYLEAWKWYWKPGRGFDRIDSFIPGLSERLGDEVVSAVNRTIRGAMSEVEVERAVYNGILNRNIPAVLERVAEETGISLEKIDDVFGPEFTGKLEQLLGPALQAGDPQKIRDATLIMREDIIRHIDDWFVQADPTEVLIDGPNGVFRVYGELQGHEFDMWDAHLKTLEEEIAHIRTLSYEEKQVKWPLLLKKEDAAWGRHFDWYQKRTGSMLDAMKKRGIDVTFTDGRKLDDVVRVSLSSRVKAIRGFHRTKRRLFDKFFDTKWDDPIAESEAWQRVTGQLYDMYNELIESESRLTRTIDESIGALLPEAQRGMFLGWRGRVRTERANYMKFNRDMYEGARDLRGSARATFFEQEYAPRRAQLIEDIKQLEKKGLSEMARGVTPAGPVAGRRGFRYRAFDNPAQALGRDVSSEANRPFRWGGAYEIEIRGTAGERVTHHPGMRRGEVRAEDVTRVFFDPEEWADDARVAQLTEDLPELRRMFPEAEFVQVRLADDPTAPKVVVPMDGEYRQFVSVLPEEAFETIPGDRQLSFFPDQRPIAPDQSPIGPAANAVYYSDGARIIDAVEDSALGMLKDKKLRFPDLGEAEQADVVKYVDHVTEQLRGTRLAAMNFAEARRDSALLNYTRRTNFDTMLGGVFPYAYWATHSMYNWALWSFERPFVLSTYLRMRKLYEVAGANRELPQRLKHYSQVPLKLPFWEDWMGEGIFVNPLRIGLPIETFMYPYERYTETERNAESQAGRILSYMLEDEEINQDQYNNAMQSQRGPIWDQAMRQAKKGEDHWFDFASMLLSPHAPLMWAWNKAMHPDEAWQPGPFLPITRHIKGVTALFGVGPPGGINIEGGIRKTLGLPEFDEWDDYRVDRMLANMAAMNEITSAEALKAMIDREGDLFEEAKRRAGKEYGARVGASMVGIPANIYPPGEERARELYRKFGKAMDAYKEGDLEAYSKFFEEHPEASARLALFDSPEERLRNFLVDEIWDRWHEMPKLHRNEAKAQFGDQFQVFFLNKETQNYDAIDPETLGVWLRSMGGTTPGTLSGETIPIEYAPPDVAAVAESFYRTRENVYSYYDVIFPLQKQYYQLSNWQAREAFRDSHPELVDYWNWRRDFLYRNPSVAPYLEDDPEQLPKYRSEEELLRILEGEPSLTAQELFSYLGPSGYNLLMDYRNLGEPLPAFLEAVLEGLGIEL